jgi:DNA-binding NarL/FixJ family response regulator
MVLHACNNRSCVRAERGHLYLGDHAQNMDDLSRVGHPRRALTAEQVLEVRASTEATRAIARRMGVSQKTVQRVRRGMIYRHVNPGGHQERG